MVIGLVAGITSIAPADLEVLYLCYPDTPEWLSPYAGSRQPFRVVAAPPTPRTIKSWASWNLPWARRAYHALRPVPPIPRSDGYLESLAPDIVHFPHQSAFITTVKSVYQPHDLQHLHLPQFFTKREIMIRESRFRAFCNQASLVAVGTTWARDDIVCAYGLSAEKVAIIPLAPVIDSYPELSASEVETLRTDLQLPPDFCFYPAQTWPHKNHKSLLRAVAELRRRDGLVVPLVFSGSATPYLAHLQRLVQELGLKDAVRWVGFVEPGQLRALYRIARCVVVPTLFESASYPIYEALSAGVAVACSNVTALPKQVGDAAIIFDPRSIDDIAKAIKRLWTDAALRDELVKRGRARIREFSRQRTARLFMANYRRVAGRELSVEDMGLLSADPII